MAKGENIFRRRDGRWEARYSKGRELSGKIKYGYCYGKTYREAKEKAEKCKAALASGNPLPTSRTPNLFSAYCMGWLHAKKSKVKESTYIKYSTVVEKHIIPKLGDCCPLGFTTELMDDFIRELQFEDELAPKTVHDILVVLHGIFKVHCFKVQGSLSYRGDQLSEDRKKGNARFVQRGTGALHFLPAKGFGSMQIWYLAGVVYRHPNR